MSQIVATFFTTCSMDCYRNALYLGPIVHGSLQSTHEHTNTQAHIHAQGQPGMYTNWHAECTLHTVFSIENSTETRDQHTTRTTLLHENTVLLIRASPGLYFRALYMVRRPTHAICASYLCLVDQNIVRECAFLTSNTPQRVFVHSSEHRTNSLTVSTPAIMLREW